MDPVAMVYRLASRIATTTWSRAQTFRSLRN
jgi:hypothetical protein